MDNYNGYRATLDYSKGWDRVGLRFNSLYQNAPGYQSGTDKIKKAWTINATTKITNNTRLTLEYERTNEWNHLWSITNGDAQNLWDGVTVNENNTPLLGDNNTLLNNQGIARLTVDENGSVANQFVWNFATGDMQDYANSYRTRGLNGTATRIPYVGNQYLLAIPSRRAAIPNINKKFKAAPKDNMAARDGDTASINLEHRIGNLFLRVGAVKNNFDNNTIWSNTSPNGAIIDINKLLPNGKPNPRFLRYFTDVEQNNIYSQDAIQEVNAMATYKFFAPRFWDYKQQLSFNVSRRNTQSENRTSAWRRTDNPTTADPFNNANRFFYRVYWDDPSADLAPLFTNPNGIAPGKWAYVDTAGGITERTVKHWGLTSQSAFFDEKVAVTASYSRDVVAVDNLPRLNGTITGSTGAPDFKNLLGFNTAGAHYYRNENVSATAVGLVTYPFQSKRGGMFSSLLAPLGFVVNYAENSQPPSTSVPQPLIDGTLPPLTHSKTKDFGLRYSLPEGKAYFTLSHYNTTQVDNPAGFGSGTDITNIWINLGYTDPKLTTTTTSGFNYSDPNSRKLEGWEAELTANPTRNITLTLNYSHPITYIVKESDDRKAYVAANRAQWEAGANAAQGAVLNGKTILDPTIIRTALNNIDNSLAGLTTGTLENNLVRHRINLAGAYGFSNGALKGLRLNAGVQYRGHGKNGSRDTRLKFGLPDSATPTTLQNTQAAFDYLWTPPAWKNSIVFGANYTTRIFKRYETRFQVNVTNVLNNLDPIWGRSGPTGNGASAYTTIASNALFAGNARTQFLTSFVNPDPRKIAFTTTVRF